MQFGGSYEFSAPRLTVWEGLNDTQILGAAIPGCDRIEWISETELDLVIKVNLGVMSPKFKGGLELSDIEPAVSYVLTGRGKGGVLGLAHGSAEIALSEAMDPTHTLLTFTATGGASGQIMKLGKSLIGTSAQHIIDGFFLRIGDAMGTSVTPLKVLDPADPAT